MIRTLRGVALAGLLVTACASPPPIEVTLPSTPTPRPTVALAPTLPPTPTSMPTALVAPATPTLATTAGPTAAPLPPVATATPANQQVRGPDIPTAATLVAVQFEAALNRGDVQLAMAMFEPGAEVKIPPDVYVGDAQIRGWLEYLAANHFSAEPGFRRSETDRVTWSLEIRSDYLGRLGLPSLDGSATLVARDGRIANYTFVLSRESASRHRAAQLAASQVLQDPVIVGLSSANIYGFNDVFRDSTGRIISYQDVLTSEPGTGPFYDLGGEVIVVRSGF